MKTEQPIKTPPRLACPTCRELILYSSKNKFRPFCSERCKLRDLGAWANEEFRIAGNPEDAAPEES